MEFEDEKGVKKMKGKKGKKVGPLSGPCAAAEWPPPPLFPVGLALHVEAVASSSAAVSACEAPLEPSPTPFDLPRPPEAATTGLHLAGLHLAFGFMGLDGVDGQGGRDGRGQPSKPFITAANAPQQEVELVVRAPMRSDTDVNQSLFPCRWKVVLDKDVNIRREKSVMAAKLGYLRPHDVVEGSRMTAG